MWLRNLTFVGVCGLGWLGMVASVAPRRPPPPTAPPSTLIEVDDDAVEPIVDQVNREFQAEWDQRGLCPAPYASEHTIMRRLSLALAGTIPSIEDLRLADSVASERRISWWTNRLLNDRRHADYFAERLARAYVGVDGGPFLIYRRRRFVSWLSDQLAANRPYDQLVRDLITADGLWTDSPAVNFLTVNSDDEQGNRPDPIRMASRTTRAFLGVRLDCMQCHDDNLGGEWQQADFHKLAAYYSEPTPSLTGIRDKRREYETQYLHHETSEVVSPAVPFAENVAHSGPSRREQLAAWVTSPNNEAFSRAMVNRVWALAYGRPLMEPIDSLPLEGPYPPGLQTLADDFAEHDFDLRRLWRIITATRPFHLDSRADHRLTDAHEQTWAAFPITRLRPEQVAGAIVQSSKLKTIDAQSHVLLRIARAAQINDFVQRYGDMGQDEFECQGETIPQRLVMLNGSLIKEVTKEELVANAATRMARLCRNDEDAITAAYEAVLTRGPAAEEMAHFLARWKQSSLSRSEFFEDLYWTLFNSTEFSWNH